jgi:hypothetical protein
MIMTRFLYYSIAAALILLLSTPVVSGEIGVQVVFSDGEASIIRAYYREHASPRNGNGMGKGMGKSGKSLPPGIAKNLQRGKPLPPGIAKQVLPSGLIRLLPRPPHGFERVVLAGKVLLVEVATQVIHDVLEDVILGH